MSSDAPHTVVLHAESLPGYDAVNVTFLIKARNEKKTNSMQWFLQAFAPHVGAELALMTDAGTFFEPHTLPEFCAQMRRKPLCVAMSGWLRAAPYRHWHDGRDLGFVMVWLNAIYTASLEMTAVLRQAQSAAGFVTCIDGAMSIYRLPLLTQPNAKSLSGATVIHEWLSIGKDISKHQGSLSSLLLKNAWLVEDKFLPYCSMFYTGVPSFTTFCMGAEAYMPFEPDWTKFTAQHRRWINGPLACDVVCLGRSLKYLLFGSDHSRWFCLFGVIFFVQAIKSRLLTALGGPALFWCTVWAIVSSAFPCIKHYAQIYFGWHMFLFSYFLAVHYSQGNVQPRLFGCIALLNGALLLLTIVALHRLLTDAILHGGEQHLHALWLAFLWSAFNNLQVYTSCSYFALTLNLRSFSRLAWSLLGYVPFSPSYTWLIASSFVQMHNTSWGNRPGAPVWEQRFAERAWCGVILALLLSTNFAFTLSWLW